LKAKRVASARLGWECVDNEKPAALYMFSDVQTISSLPSWRKILGGCHRRWLIDWVQELEYPHCTNFVGTVKEEDRSMEQKMVNLTKFQVWYEHSSMSFSTGKRPCEKWGISELDEISIPRYLNTKKPRDHYKLTILLDNCGVQDNSKFKVLPFVHYY
jgi:hypothetical protein